MIKLFGKRKRRIKELEKKCQSLDGQNNELLRALVDNGETAVQANNVINHFKKEVNQQKEEIIKLESALNETRNNFNEAIKISQYWKGKYSDLLKQLNLNKVSD